MLPEILPSAAVASFLTATSTTAIGVHPGLTVTTGAGEVTALAGGCGIVYPGRIAITLGTAGQVVSEAADPALLVGGGLWSIPHAKAYSSLSLGLIISGGLSLNWLRETISMGGNCPISQSWNGLPSKCHPVPVV